MILNDKFWEKVNKTSGCWIWIGATRSGYGAFKQNGKIYAAHRASYEFFFGVISGGKFVCHHCDNPSCINPAHLFLGTSSDNMIDCSKKGRIFRKKSIIEVPEGYLQCSLCRMFKSREMFPAGIKKERHTGECRDCHSKRMRAWRSKK